MKLTKPIFQNAEALSRALQAEKISRKRFSLEVTPAVAADYLQLAYRAEVSQRNRQISLDASTCRHIDQVACWLTDSSASPGLMMCGMPGNGKTTLASAIARLIGYVTEQELGYGNRLNMPLYTAKEICRLCAASEKQPVASKEFERLPREKMLIIDDLGEEARDVMVYGMIHTPVIDLLNRRYSNQRMTVITTNLNVRELRTKYGERIYDRFREMYTIIVFDNDSYR